MAYGRAITATAGGVTLINVSSVTEDTQHCHFEIYQRTTQSPNTAKFRVYNPSKSTALAVPDGVKTKGTLTITAGYEDEGVALLFTGDIKQRRIGKVNAVTTYVEVIAADGDQAYNAAKVNTRVDKNKTPQDVVEAAVQAMSPFGVKMGYVSPGLLSSPTYPRGQVFFSLAREVLRNVARSAGDASWSIQNGEVQIVRKDDSLPGTIDVNASTGMIGMPQITPNGILVRTLLNGNIKPNSSIRLNQSDLQNSALTQSGYGNYETSRFALDSVAASTDGTYKVFAVDRTGALRGEEWYNEITCVGSSGFAQGQLAYPDFTTGNQDPSTQPGGVGSGAQSQAQGGGGGAQGGPPASSAGGSTPNFGSGNGRS